ncbi:5-formyltetrahydrofolate cyclo-ligase [Liquorilactobacillus aquaticus DSM 21051]|uniref:5-formyltetrahydrofolate cyclo-ligase n=1 Tax=Liquorilactobacillus aquaticus DSM 21051 TaxID=1423725 RepID=A0A0R2CXK1_9LACO|nr:5-formyltetrahydrofolate cyclo-ligase [Liquorilactobacillus aquaticus]KRM96589.1 5-formyltetrahydrofolate cyclo-ligase [Liquorilactobacillus aquaticus DSM 21051]
METKEAIRHAQLNKISKNNKTWTNSINEIKLYESLFADSIWKTAQVVGVTLSSDNEIDTKPIILQARLQSKKVCVPRTRDQYQMDFFKLESRTVIRKNDFGIYEPRENINLIQKKEIDLMIVPGIAFSLMGDRVGFGGGYYDRYLSDFKGTTVSLADPLRLYEDRTWRLEKTDQQIDKIVTVER